MTPADLLVAFRDNQPDVLEVVGQLRDVAAGTSVLIVVLGAMPWRDQLWQKRQRVQADGCVELSLPVERRHARWVLVCTQHGSAAPEGVLLHTLPVPPNVVPVAALTLEGATFRQWERCFPFLDAVHLPHDLRQLVRLTRVDLFRRHPALATCRQAGWTTLSTVACCKRVDEWRALGVDVPVALCEGTPSTASFNRAALYLTPVDVPACRELLRRPGVTLAVNLRHPNGVRSPWQDGKLVSGDDEGDVVIRLQSREVLYCCAECRVVIPLHLAIGHAHLSVRNDACRRDGANRSRAPRVRLVAFFDPLEVLLRFQQTLQQAIAGQDVVWPAIFEAWLNALYGCFETSGFSQQDRWLEGLTEAIGALLRLLDSGCHTDVTAADQLLVLTYQPALITLMQLIEEF